MGNWGWGIGNWELEISNISIALLVLKGVRELDSLKPIHHKQ